MNRYESNQKGTSPALSALINEFAKMPQSAFDETRRKSLDIAPYAIVPSECFLMFPHSKGYINYDVQAITKNPTIRRMLSGMTIELRTYKCKCSDLWEGWNNFITRGRSGKVDLTIPYLDFVHNSHKHTALPYNPYHYMNIAPAVMFDNTQSFKSNQGIKDPAETRLVAGVSEDVYSATGLQGTSFALESSDAYTKGVSALPAVMYAKIAKEYQNSNLLQDNPNWYPENENHDLILPYDCTHASTASYDNPTRKFEDSITLPDGTTGSANEIQPTNDVKSYPWLNVLYYKQRKGNYFNTGSPFPDLIRGDVPTLDIIGAELESDVIDKVSGGSISSITASLNYGNDAYYDGTTSYGLFLGIEPNNNIFTAGARNTGNDRIQGTTTYRTGVLNALNKGKVNINQPTLTDPTYKIHSKVVNGLQISMNQWRKLATMTVFKERMARTDGSYNQMIEAQFKWNPKWHEHSVTYCGGSVQPIVFSEVVQTSEDGSSPLGTTAGRAVSSSYNEQIYVEADDYTIVMTVLTITPDDYYSQGLKREWTELLQSQQYFPILNNLAPQAILNKELFLSGDDSVDEDVLNYQELFSHFKSRQNEVSGLLALPIEKVGDTGAFIFNRLFEDTPQFNNKFVTGEFTDNENLCFASTEQAQFVISMVSQFKYIAPMPAVTQPSDMGISY